MLNVQESIMLLRVRNKKKIRKYMRYIVKKWGIFLHEGTLYHTVTNK